MDREGLGPVRRYLGYLLRKTTWIIECRFSIPVVSLTWFEWGSGELKEIGINIKHRNKGRGGDKHRKE
jgi:hypothetical protein